MTLRAKTGIWIVAAVVVAALFVVTGARRLQKEEVESIESVQETEGIPVDVVRSQVLRVEDWREFVGVAEGCDQVDLIAPFRTRVCKVHARVGEEVPAGSVIVSLDPYDPAHFAMNLEAAEKQYETATQDSIRMEELFKSGAISQQDLDHARSATAAARAHYLTARRAVELDTPVSGIVTAVGVEGGDYAASEQTLATVSSYDRVRIRLSVSGAERWLIEVGQSVRLELDARRSGTKGCTIGNTVGERLVGDGAALRGSVVKAALSADPASRLFEVEVVVENPDHLLRPGTLAAPQILVASTDDQPVVPPIAIMKHNDRQRLYVIEDSSRHPVARLRSVVRGVENGALVAITEGLSPGEVVVVWGHNKLHDGARVRIHSDLTADYCESGR